MKRKPIHLSAKEQALMESLLKRQMTAENPRKEFRDELYGRLVRSYVHQQSKDESRVRGATFSLYGMFRFWLVTAVVLICVAGTGFTTAYAYISPDVTRSSNLYFLKRTVESLELLASSSPEQLSRLHLKLANRRLDEAKVLSGQGTVDEETLQEIVSNTEEARKLATTVQDSKQQIALNTDIAAESQKQRTDLVVLVQQLESESAAMSSVSSSQESAVTSSPSSVAVESVTDSPASSSSSVSRIESRTQMASSQPTTGVALPPVSDAATIGALEKTIADIGKVEMSAASTAMKVSEQTGVTVSQPLRLPDLAVSLQPGLDVSEGEAFSVTVVVKNIGQRGAPATQLAVIWGDGKTENLPVFALNRDDIDTRILTHTYLSPGTYILRVQVDPQGLMSELTTANNRATASIQIQAIPRDGCPGNGIRRCSGQELQVCKYANGAKVLSWELSETCQSSSVCTVNGCQSSVVCGNGKVEGSEECDDGNTNNADGCSSTCRKEAESCSDSDGGIADFTKGTVRLSLSGITQTDACISSQKLQEFYCAGKMYLSTNVDCQYGCQNGACLPQSAVTQVCGNGNKETGEECDLGSSNGKGWCTASCKILCLDEDGGKVFDVRAGTYSPSFGAVDNCKDSKTLYEYYCENGVTTSMSYICPGICNNGACVPVINPAPVCGNGIVDSTEQCDDGNKISGDGCSSDCQKEVVAPVTCTDSDGGYAPMQVGTVKVNKAGGLSATDYCETAINLREYSCTGDASFTSVSASCTNGCKDGACLASPVFVCGNGKVEGSEQCDDGNTTSDDGCTFDCRIETLSCAAIKAQSFASVTNGTVTAYVNDYGLYVCKSGNDTPVQIEVKYAGANFPVMAGDNLVYFKSYGIVLYNVSTKVKTELEPASSGSNSPVIGGRYVAYFKNYGIVLYNIDTKQKTQVEQPNSGCSNPRISGTVLTYSCNSTQKTYNIEDPVCGNSTLEFGEQCDDGNTLNGDGCSSTCVKEISTTVTLNFTIVDVLTGLPVAGVHDAYINQPQSDASGKLTLIANREGSNWLLEKGCYGYYQVKVQKDYLGKSLALILRPFDGAERVYEISGMNSVDVRSVAGDIALYPFAQFKLESLQPVTFTLAYDYKQLVGSSSISMSTASTSYLFHPGIPRGYEARNVQVRSQDGTALTCPAYTPSTSYDPGQCREAVLTVNGSTCAWHE